MSSLSSKNYINIQDLLSLVNPKAEMFSLVLEGAHEIVWECGGLTPLWYFGRSPFSSKLSAQKSRSATIPKLRQAGALPKALPKSESKSS